MLEFEILGPLVVRDEKATIAIAGARRRALLVRLLVTANELVPASVLAEDLWAEEASSATASTLQSHISLLRKALGPKRLVGRDGGYVLDVADDELDVRRFEAEAGQARDALGAGDPGTASRLLSTALGRWHGAALADVSGAAWARPEQSRLEELRVGATETWLETRLELGEHQEVVALAEAAVADHPLREQIWASLMLALYRSGRQSDALRTYQRLRSLLGEELGIEPSAPLVALDDAIVQQKPELDWSGPGSVATERWRWPRATATGVSPVPGSDTDRPPLHAPWQLERHHNLPEQISSFVGRTQERQAVRNLIESHRLVTLAGPGGTGKTRLALETASDLLDTTRDGVWLVELAPVADEELVASTCAAALGIAEQPDRVVLDALAEALRNKHLLLVLDNCEHLLGACHTVADALLKQCPRVHVICTSREPLSITGEHVYRVPPLLVPEVSQESNVEELLGVDAVALFCERAMSHQPAFILDRGSATAVGSICRALDGVPLALELAAARLESMSVTDLESRLDERFRLLTKGSRAALPRQQTLRGLVDWSYELLEEKERSALCRLSVFSGGWRLSEAEEVVVGGDISTFDVLDLVSSLVAKSLVQLESGTATSRYGMLETIRHYAAERAVEQGQSSAAAQAHARVFAALAETAAAQLRGPQAGEWFDRLDDELDNLRAAAAHLLDRPDSGPQVLGLAIALCGYWETRGSFTEGISMLHAALDRPDTQAPSLLRARALSCLAGLGLRSGSVAEAYGCSVDGLAMARTHGDGAVTSELLRTLVWATSMQGDIVSTTFDMADEAVTLARQAQDAFATGRALMTRGALLCISDTAKARTDWEEALSLLRVAGDRVFVANTQGNLAYMDMLEHQPAAARERLVEAIAIAHDIGAVGNIPSLMVNLGLAEILEEDHKSAVHSLRESVVAADRIGDRQGVACAMIGLALCSSAAGELSRAASLHGMADALCHENDLPLEPLERQLAEEDRKTLRTQLASDEYERAFESGYHVPAIDRLAYVLQ